MIINVIQTLSLIACLALAIIALGRVALQHWRRKYRGYSLPGRTVLVTGAARGIGLELCKRLLAEHVGSLIMVDLDSQALDLAHGELSSIAADQNVLKFVCDVADFDGVKMLATSLRDANECVDVLVNNAGIVGGGMLHELGVERFDATVRVNCVAHAALDLALMPSMIERGHGRLVCIASVMAESPCVGLADYCASKAAATRLHECLRLELAKRRVGDVRTLLVAPYAVRTDMFRGIETAFSRTLLPHLDVDYVASAVIGALGDGTPHLVLPEYLSYINLIARALPVELFDAIVCMLGGANGMDNFVGRNGKEKRQ
jgi:NAD(P)-dependent dehydrogenase (short-subunit alcohol dehydrogenase family)